MNKNYKAAPSHEDGPIATDTDDYDFNKLPKSSHEERAVILARAAAILGNDRLLSSGASPYLRDVTSALQILCEDSAQRHQRQSLRRAA